MQWHINSLPMIRQALDMRLKWGARAIAMPMTRQALDTICN